MRTDFLLGVSEEGFHRVAYTEWGTPNKTNVPIICVHGLTRNGRDFDSLANYLSYLGAHVFCPDIVGRGESDWLKNPLHYTYEQYIADMNALIARTHATQVDWIGTSMGGLIGMFLAAAEQSPIRRLILNDIGAQVPAKGLARLAKYVGKDPEFTSFDAAKAYFKATYADFGKLTEEQWQHFTKNSIREITPSLFVTKIDHGVKLGTTKSKIALHSLLHPLRALEGTLFDFDLWHVWRKIKCPVLLIHGKNSDMLLPNIIEKMQQIHSEITVIEIPDAGHAPALLDPTHHEMIYRWLIKTI